MILRTVKETYPNGTPRVEYTVNGEGKLHGTCQDWHSNGQLYEQCEYMNGKRHGTCHYWRENGQLWQQYEYANGKCHGLLYTWRLDGSLWYIKQWDKDELLVEVTYIHNSKECKVAEIEIYNSNIESTAFVANIIIQLTSEGIEYEITHG